MIKADESFRGAARKAGQNERRGTMAKKNLKETIFGAEENSAAKLDPGKLSKFHGIAARM
jgi:hypothetical protein